ncbi:hypothetical protein MJO28_003533 [Puccinia striiformis f. sp. tritici]|uniref:Uncharacterized protein n=1 Tax=Puccinia striiformis f. sp. tritici TaxID=168172 RepID=A0ACC0ENI5_9BASI|nr:hypothetical protein MJO28_003533 [Puccinia striiformis f. sp. tritici]
MPSNHLDLCHLNRQTPKLDSVVCPDEAGWIVDLCKDSETEDPKTAPGKKFDAARIFFGEAFYLSKVTKKDHPITFICKWCKKQVCGARDTGANLRKHQDGSNQVGRDGSGCPKQNLAIQAGAFLPPTVNECKALADAQENQNGHKKLTAYFG